MTSLPVVAVVDDIFFVARIRETARQTGVPIQVVPAAQFGATLARQGNATGVASVIVDLGSAGAVDLIRKIKTNAPTQKLFVLAFASHVATGLIAAAREAGCDQVIARSAFTRDLPDLLRRLAGSLDASP